MRRLLFKFISTVFIALTSLCTFGQNNFVGTYTNLFVGLNITINSDYTGVYNVLDQTYPVKATLVNNNQLTGNYPYNGQEVSFDIIFDGNRYKIKTEGIELRLVYQPKTQNQTLSESPDMVNYNSDQNGGERLEVKLNQTLRSFPAGGYQFKGPSGWSHQLVENDIHFFQSKDQMSSMIILPHDYSDINEVKLAAQTEGIQEDNMILMPSGQIENYGSNGLMGTFLGWIDAVNAKACIISLFSPYGGGLTIMTYAQKSKFNSSYIEATKKIASSIKFSKPVESAIAKQWKAKLNNRKLVYYNTGSNSTEKITYTLYDNSQFIYYSSYSYASSDTYNDYSSASQDDDTGNWKIKEDHNGVFIEFKYNNGSISQQYLKMKEGSNAQVLLNGSRYFIRGIDE